MVFGPRVARGCACEIRKGKKERGRRGGTNILRDESSRLLVSHPQHLMATKAVPAVHSAAMLSVQFGLIHRLVAFYEADEFVEEANHS
jgi:hypothetical protein